MKKRWISSFTNGDFQFESCGQYGVNAGDIYWYLPQFSHTFIKPQIIQHIKTLDDRSGHFNLWLLGEDAIKLLGCNIYRYFLKLSMKE